MNLHENLEELTDILGAERVKDALTKLTRIEADRRLLNINKLKREVDVFERKFHISSQQAWESYQKGELGDDMDIMEWMAIYENILEYHFEDH